MSVSRCVKIGLAAALSLGIGALSYAKTELNLVFLANTNDEEHDAALVFKNYVENYTAGEITVKIFPGAQLCGSALECFESLKAGDIDLFVATAGGTSSIYPVIQGMDIPYLLQGDRVAQAVMEDTIFLSEVGKRILKATGNQIRVLSMGNTGGWRNFANSKHEIKSPADVKGLKLRTIESEIQQMLVRNMGGTPTSLPFMEVYTALQTGMIDGTKNSISDITNMKFQEKLKYMTLDGHAYMAAMWFMGNKRFEKLTATEKQVVVDAGALMGTVMAGIQPRKELQAYEDWTKSGGKIYIPTAEEMSQFREQAKPIREWYLKKFGEEGTSFLAEYEAAIKRAEEQVKLSRQAVEG